MAKLTLRVALDGDHAVGPGKIRLLEHLRDTGSIAAAGRAMEMSYRRAWLLIEALNQSFSEPVVSTQLGGRNGGGALLTRFGEELIARYRAMEKAAHGALRSHLAALDKAKAPARAAAATPSGAARRQTNRRAKRRAAP